MKRLCLIACVMTGIILLSASYAAADQSERVIPVDPSIAQDHYTDGAASFADIPGVENSPYFVSNDYYTMRSGGSLHLIPRFRTYQQTTEYTCGCACALMVLDYYGVDGYNELEIAGTVGTDPTKGTSVEGLTAFFRDNGFDVVSHGDTQPAFASVDEAKQFFVDSIDAGIPVMVDWLDWRGHWQVLIGIDTMNTESAYDDVLIFADPYDVTDHLQDGYYIFPLGRFYDMWREGVCAGKAIPYEQVYVKAWRSNVR